MIKKLLLLALIAVAGEALAEDAIHLAARTVSCLQNKGSDSQRGTALANEIINYRGYELHVGALGMGVRVSIRVPGSLIVRPEIPFSPDEFDRPRLISEAKAIVDALSDLSNMDAHAR